MNGHFRFKDKEEMPKRVRKAYGEWYNSLTNKQKRKLSNYNETFPKGLTKKQIRREKRLRKLSST